MNPQTPSPSVQGLENLDFVHKQGVGLRYLPGKEKDGDSPYISKVRYRRAFIFRQRSGTENPVPLPGGVAAAGGGEVRVAAEVFPRELLVAGAALGLLLGRHCN